MSSLKFIMDVVDDQSDPRGVQQDQHPSVSAHLGRRQTLSPTSLSAVAASTSAPSHVNSSSGNPFDQRIPNSAVPTAAGQRQKRGGPSPRGSLSSLQSSNSTFGRDTTAVRRRSTTSNESMDLGGYGSASSSSMGGGLNPSNSPMRPMPNSAPGNEMPIKLTPITGRVSRAKKGVPVHTCDICKPPKTFTRAEHLRRHQLSHQTPGFPCRYPGCDRAFHRSDLLARHQQRHEQEGDKIKSSGDDENRRTSRTSSSQSHMSVDDGYGSASVMPGGQGTGATPTSSVPQDLPSTPNASGGHASPYAQLSNSPTAHQMSGGSSGFRSPAASSQDYSGYTLSPRAPTVSVIHPSRAPSSMSGPGFSSVLDHYQQPRTTPPSIFVVTQGLSRPSPQISDNAPDLYHHDNSPYVSSSDSTYSTPASDISRGPRFQWVQSRPSPQPEWPQLLSPYPNASSRELSSPADVMSATGAGPLFVNAFTPSPHFASAHQPHAYGTMLDVSMAGYHSADTHHPMLSPSSETTYRPHSVHHGNPAASVRSPTPPPNTSSHTTDILVSPTPALPSRLDSMAVLARQKELAVEIVSDHAGLVSMGALADLSGTGAFANHTSPGASGDGSGTLAALEIPMNGCGAPVPSMAIPLPRTVRAAIPDYLEVYWAQVHRVCPIVHRPSFEGAAEDVLRCAMAALATQYLDTKEDRNRGNQLHEYAWQEAKRIPQWSLQVMQAILLCEYFARFRGRKAVTRPSKLFESLYSRVLYHNPAMFDPAVLNPDQHLAAEDRWHAWLDAEARRRLLTACFVVDIHTSTLQQQRRAHECDMSGGGVTPPPIPLTGPSSALWEAASAEQWTSLLEADPTAGSPTFVPQVEMLTSEDMQSYTDFDCGAILAVETLRLQVLPGIGGSTAFGQSPSLSSQPEFDLCVQHAGDQFTPNQQLSNVLSLEAEERISTLYAGCAMANTYLAMRHTPLHDLLAVSGDSWVFSQKVLPANSFLEHKKRLKLWAEQQQTGQHHQRSSGAGSFAGMSATKATIYATRAILAFLCGTQPRTACSTSTSNSERMGDWGYDISGYWALYVCALICWAFGHRVRAGGDRTHSGSSGSGTGNPPRGLVNPSPSDDDTLAWLQLVAGMCIEDAARVPGRREASGVVGLVRRRLETDCIGGKSRLYVDAVGVLKKLEEGANWKWF